MIEEKIKLYKIKSHMCDKKNIEINIIILFKRNNNIIQYYIVNI